jgi:phytoene dehydrogenase-like protein
MVETRAVPKVVIVGGGHNGLVTAALLARHGMDVTVLEKNEKVGGAASTGHPWGPDIDMTRCSYSLGMMDQELIDDLELETRFGLRRANQLGYFAPRQNGYLQLPDDDPQLLEKELTTKAGPEDLLRFKNFKPTLKKINTILQTGRRPDPQGEQAQALMRELQQASVGDILDHGFRSVAAPGIELGPFESEALKGILSVTPVIGIWGGPYDKASTYALLNLQGDWGFPVGGMGAVSGAIERSATANGAKIRVNALVEHIDVIDRRARGVVLRDGTKIPADVIVTTVHPQISYLELITSGLPNSFVNRIKDWDSRSGVVKINLVVSKLPTFKDHAAFDKEVHGGTIVIGVDSPSKIQSAFEEAAAGSPSTHPMIDMAIPSVADPTLIRGLTREQYPEAHVISLFTQFGLEAWSKAPDSGALAEYVDRVLETIEGVAPGFRDSILPNCKPEVLGPHEIQELYGLKGGNIYGGAWGWNDRLDVTTPIEHLYDASSGTHNGGCVSGKPGLRAASQIIVDCEARGARSQGTRVFR